MSDENGARSPADARVLAFLARELRELPGRVAAIEAHVADLAAQCAPDPATRMALQDLDLVRQELDDLARLAAAAAQGSVGTDQLTRCILLGDLRERFADASGLLGEETSSGSVEFFPLSPATRAL